MRIFAGFDGGGTKTACVLCNEEGTLLGTGLGGPSNYLYCGKELAAASIRQAQEQAFQHAEIAMQTIDTAYMASAAIRLQNGRAHISFFQTCIDAAHLLCESDLYPIWFGAMRQQPAVVSIVGTGSITYVCRPNAFLGVGGWGPLLGDEGSGYDIGLQALRLAARMSDGREEADSTLCGAILQHYDVPDARSLIRILNQGDTRSKVASVAQLVIELAKQSNPSANRLLKNAASEIALAIAAACRQDSCPEPLPLILSGSLVQQNSPLFPLVKQFLPSYTDRIRIVKAAAAAPAVSAAALALHSQGLDEAAERLLCQSGGDSR